MSQKPIEELINWSLKEFSHLPWRKERSLYRTLVSEIMLQQTTVSTVLKHFERFIDEYPTPYDIARASEEQLLISWKGLGYYRRARNLQKACLTICSEFNGEIPLEFDDLIKINGIGVYTANAIRAMGANIKALAVDANLERIISRLYGIDEEKGPKLQKLVVQKFNNDEICQDIDSVGARVYNEALMDLGRNYCQSKKASCELCVLSSECFASRNHCANKLPKITDKKKESYSLNLLRVLVQKNDEFLVYKKSEKQWLSGQYEVPTFIIESEDESLDQYPKISGEFWALPTLKTSITKYKIINSILWVDESEFKDLGLNLDDYKYGKVNLSTSSIKAIKL